MGCHYLNIVKLFIVGKEASIIEGLGLMMGYHLCLLLSWIPLGLYIHVHEQDEYIQFGLYIGYSGYT